MNHALSMIACAMIAVGCTPEIHHSPSLRILATASSPSPSSSPSSPPLPTHLAFISQPTSTSSGASLGTITAAIEDANGNIVTSSNDPVTLSIGTNAGPGGILSGTITSSAVDGVATFSGLSIDKAGAGYTLIANAPSLTDATSASFNISAAAPARLVFTNQPSNTTAGQTIDSGTGVIVKVEDSNGNLVTGSSASITLSLNNPPINGTTTISASSGVATFSNLSINQAANGYQLTASASGLSSAVSSSFDVTVGPVANIIFSIQPTNSNITAGSTILSSTSSALQATLQDAEGNTVSGSSQTVSIAIGNNAGGGTLHGTLSASTTTGVASFGNLWIDKAASGYTLKASAGSTSGTSSSFTITAGAASTFTVSGSTVLLANSCNYYTLYPFDSYGNAAVFAASTTFNLSSSSSHLGLYSGYCASSITSVTPSANATSYQFTANDTAVESTSFQVSQASWSVTVHQSVTSETQLVVTGPANVSVGSCNAYTLTNEDGQNNPIALPANITATAVWGDGGAVVPGGYFGSDSTCSTGSLSLNLTAGQSSATFYFSTPNALVASAGVTLNYTASNYLSDALSITSTPGTPTQLAITGQSVVTTASCSTVFHVSPLDAHGNHTSPSSPATVTMSSSGGTQFYSDSGCTMTLSSGNLTIAASSQYGVFYSKSSLSESATLTASSSGLTSGTFKLLTQSTAPTFVAASFFNNACVAINGDLKCAGTGAGLGRLGNGTNNSSVLPVQVSGLTSGVTQIAMNLYATCALTSSGIFCWGNGYGGNIGNGSDSNQNTPHAVSVLSSNITQLVGGGSNFCAIQSGTVYCWGANSSGQLGVGNTNNSNVPEAVTLPDDAVSVSIGPATVCALLNNGQIWCWGDGSQNVLLNGGTGSSVPVQITGLPGAATAIAVDSGVGCALVAGTPYCWGYNLTPHTVGFSGTYTQLAFIEPTNSVLSALRNDGSVWLYSPNSAWGYFAGNGTTEISGGSAPVESLITSGGTALNNYNPCVVVTLDSQPTLKCWTTMSGGNGQYSPGMDGSSGYIYTIFDTFSWN